MTKQTIPQETMQLLTAENAPEYIKYRIVSELPAILTAAINRAKSQDKATANAAAQMLIDRILGKVAPEAAIEIKNTINVSPIYGGLSRQGIDAGQGDEVFLRGHDSSKAHILDDKKDKSS